MMQIASPFPAEIRCVGVFSCSGAPDALRMERGLGRLRDWGIEAVVGTPEGPAVRYLAASDAARLKAFHDLVSREDISFLMASRGGFGITRLLDELDWGLLRERGKWLCGYSDVTALLLAAYAHGCRRLIHGPMLCSTLGREDSPALADSIRSFGQCMRGAAAPLTQGAVLRPLRNGCVRGPVIPCNLTLLCSLLGTEHLPSLRGCVLALEDVHEPAHAIDRSLAHLWSAGALRGLGGLLFGQFTEGEDAEYLPEVMEDWAARMDCPVACGLPFGHGFPSMSLLFGAEVELRCGGGVGFR